MGKLGLAGVHCLRKAVEEVVAILRAGAGFGVVLHRKYRPFRHANAAVRTIKQRNVGFFHAVRQGLAIHGEAVLAI